MELSGSKKANTAAAAVCTREKVFSFSFFEVACGNTVGKTAIVVVYVSASERRVFDPSRKCCPSLSQVLSSPSFVNTLSVAVAEDALYTRYQ